MKKSFATLIKLQKTFVDEQRQILARLHESLDCLDARIMDIENQKAQERAAAQKNPAASMTLGVFLRSMIAKERMLMMERQRVARAVQVAQDRLAELFEDQKRYEIAEEERLEEIARTERRLETLQLDEVGSIRHQRQRAE